MNFPTYTLLWSVSTRKVRADLARLEKSPKQDELRGAFERGILASRLLPTVDDQILNIFVRGADSIALVIPSPDESASRCIPVFTERWRAMDYVLTLHPRERDLRVAVMSAAEFVATLRDLEKNGSFTFAIDRCPRCDGFLTYETSMADTPGHFIRMMVVQKAAEMAQRHLYWTYALTKAHGAQFEVARDVALEIVAHVTMADPNTHLLLGQVGIALGDDQLVREAHTFLRFFQNDAMDKKLELDEEAGKPQFAESE